MSNICLKVNQDISTISERDALQIFDRYRAPRVSKEIEYLSVSEIKKKFPALANKLLKFSVLFQDNDTRKNEEEKPLSKRVIHFPKKQKQQQQKKIKKKKLQEEKSVKPSLIVQDIHVQTEPASLQQSITQTSPKQINEAVIQTIEVSKSQQEIQTDREIQKDAEKKEETPKKASSNEQSPKDEKGSPFTELLKEIPVPKEEKVKIKLPDNKQSTDALKEQLQTEIDTTTKLAAQKKPKEECEEDKLRAIISGMTSDAPLGIMYTNLKKTIDKPAPPTIDTRGPVKVVCGREKLDELTNNTLEHQANILTEHAIQHVADYILGQFVEELPKEKEEDVKDEKTANESTGDFVSPAVLQFFVSNNMSLNKDLVSKLTQELVEDHVRECIRKGEIKSEFPSTSVHEKDTDGLPQLDLNTSDEIMNMVCMLALRDVIEEKKQTFEKSKIMHVPKPRDKIPQPELPEKLPVAYESPRSKAVSLAKEMVYEEVKESVPKKSTPTTVAIETQTIEPSTQTKTINVAAETQTIIKKLMETETQTSRISKEMEQSKIIQTSPQLSHPVSQAKITQDELKKEVVFENFSKQDSEKGRLIDHSSIETIKEPLFSPIKKDVDNSVASLALGKLGEQIEFTKSKEEPIQKEVQKSPIRIEDSSGDESDTYLSRIYLTESSFEKKLKKYRAKRSITDTGTTSDTFSTSDDDFLDSDDDQELKHYTLSDISSPLSDFSLLEHQDKVLSERIERQSLFSDIDGKEDLLDALIRSSLYYAKPEI